MQRVVRLAVCTGSDIVGAAIMAGCTVAGDADMVEGRWREGAYCMADIAVLCGRDMGGIHVPDWCRAGQEKLGMTTGTAIGIGAVDHRQENIGAESAWVVGRVMTVAAFTR